MDEINYLLIDGILVTIANPAALCCTGIYRKHGYKTVSVIIHGPNLENLGKWYVVDRAIIKSVEYVCMCM